MFNLQFPIDPKLTAVIERRRQREQERKNRILDEKKRRIGIDTDALKMQINHKIQQDLTDRVQQQEIEKEMLFRDQMAMQASERERAHRRELDKAIDKFRLTCQRPETQRDFDLYDPNALKKAKPVRYGDFDPRCGPSSLQIFSGEDLYKTERDRRLKELQKIWLNQQQQEKNSTHLHLRNLEESQDEESIRLSKIARERMNQELNYRKNLEKSIQSYNQQLLQHKISHTRLMKQRELEMDNVEMRNHIFSDILAEDPRMAISALSPHRVIPDRWKGMSSEQVMQILNSQREQAIRKKMTQAAEKREDNAWDHQILLASKADLLRERERQRLTHDYHRHLMEENKRLAIQQKSFQDFMNRKVYRGEIQQDFFTQFGQSCR